MVVTASHGGTDEPVASIAEYDVQVRNVASLLTDAELLGALEGLVHGHNRGILHQQLKEGIEYSRHIKERPCAKTY